MIIIEYFDDGHLATITDSITGEVFDPHWNSSLTANEIRELPGNRTDHRTASYHLLQAHRFAKKFRHGGGIVTLNDETP